MKRFFCSISVILICFILCGCITEFEAKDVNEMEGILVVEGIITDDESVITLSRSKGLSYEDNIFDLSPYHVTDAKVYIECDDGTQWGALVPPDFKSGGQYAIKTGKLNPERQYRLKIELEEHEYHSEFDYPMVTPEIDSVFWTKKDKGLPVNIHVATHTPDNAVHYFRWSYRENWVTRARVPMFGYPSFCSKNYHSKGLSLGTNDKKVSDQIIEILTEISPVNDRLSVLYRIDVTQNEISKRAYDYFTNIKKNARQAGSIFAHVPSELRGNILCVTDPVRPVIGYMDVTSATQGRLYIYSSEEIFEGSHITGVCQPVSFNPGSWYALAADGYYYPLRCIDCIEDGGRPISELPDDWLYQYGED